MFLQLLHFVLSIRQPYLGGYCSGVPPLPIPNREVKPACADGTAMQCGRVGDCPLSIKKPFHQTMRGLFFLAVGYWLLAVGLSYIIHKGVLIVVFLVCVVVFAGRFFPVIKRWEEGISLVGHIMYQGEAQPVG